jgi:hypothetical protein
MPDYSTYDIGEQWYDINEFFNMSQEDQAGFLETYGFYNPDPGLGEEGDFNQAVNDWYNSQIYGSDSAFAQGWGPVENPNYDPDYGGDQWIDESLSQMYGLGLFGTYMPTTYDEQGIYSIEESANIQKDLLSERFIPETLADYQNVAGISNLAMGGTRMTYSPYEDLYGAYSSIDIDTENALSNLYTSYGEEWTSTLNTLAQYDISDLDFVLEEALGSSPFGNWGGSTGTEIEGADLSYQGCMEAAVQEALAEGWGAEAYAVAGEGCNAIFGFNPTETGDE